MLVKVHNKLVRDRIPEIIEKENRKAITRVLDSQDYTRELNNKLLEECNEVLATSGSDKVDELADVLEVVCAIGSVEGVTLEEIIKRAEIKRAERGGFSKRIFLESVIDNE